MSTQDDDYQGVLWPVLFGILLLVIGLVLGIAIFRTGKPAAAPLAPASAAASGVVSGGMVLGTAATAIPDGASVRVEEGVVKFYFASGSAELATGAKEALADVVMGVAAGRKAVISGYHDTTGDPARNEELAKQRAIAVRDTLAALGIGEDKLELKKPEVTTATGSNAEARRVEVRLE
ncbi:OmpA family protein [Ottowia sp.]|uniref:OmpA family protein n=1 Tax=Ottowia sp. TaxID=1898956 RepID=UPI0039E21A8A